MTTSLEKMALMSKTLLCQKIAHQCIVVKPCPSNLGPLKHFEKRDRNDLFARTNCSQRRRYYRLKRATLLCAFPKRRCLSKNRVGLGTKSLINAFQHRVNSCCATVTFSSRFDCLLATCCDETRQLSQGPTMMV